MTKLYKYQKIGVKRIIRFRGRALLADEMGLGKAQPMSSKLLTPKGWKRMKNISTEDLVFGSDGEPHRVAGVYKQGIKKIYRVYFSDGSSTKCCGEHLWSVQTPCQKWRGKSYTTKSLNELKDTLTLKNGNRKYFIPITKPLQFPHRKQPIDPYVIGVLLGDGYLKHMVSLSNADSDIIERFKKRLPKGMTLNKTSSKYDYRVVNICNIGRKRNKPNLLNKVLTDLKIKVGSEKKFIPKIYKFGSIRQRTLLLQGLLDTDGGITDNIIEYNTVSKQLCKDVQFLVESFGGKAKMIKKIPTYKYNKVKMRGQIAYRLSLSFPASFVPFLCERKAIKYKPHTKYLPTRAMVKVEYVGKEECQCIAIDSKDHLYITDRCILTHNTLQALTFLKLRPQCLPALVVCPASVKWVWRNEIKEHTIFRPSIINGTNVRKGNPRDITIINYDLLHSWKKLLKKLGFKTLILDECHYIKSKKAQRTLAAVSIGKKTPYILALSGTPLTNRPNELFKVINLLHPKEFPSYSNYAWRYCGRRLDRFSGKWDDKGATHLDELHKKLKGLCMIRRTKKQVLKELPDKRRIVMPLELSPKDLEEYQNIQYNLIAHMRHTKVSRLSGYRRVAITMLRVHKQKAAEFKMKALLNWIDDFLEETDEKLVVFAWHVNIIQQIYDHYKKRIYNGTNNTKVAKSMARRLKGEPTNFCVKLHGSVATKERNQVIGRFQNSDDCRIFVGQLLAAGTGISLTSASNILMAELDFTPANHIQAEDRCHRIGQKNSVTIYYAIAKDTIEERLCRILQKKFKTVSVVLDGKSQNVKKEYNIYDLLLNTYKKGK